MTKHTRVELAAMMKELVLDNCLQLIIEALSDACNELAGDALRAHGHTPTGRAVAGIWSRVGNRLAAFDVYGRHR